MRRIPFVSDCNLSKFNFITFNNNTIEHKMSKGSTHISIISASIRIDRKSHRIALYLKSFIEKKQEATCEILDLSTYKFPIFDERLKFQKRPSEKALDFAGKIKSSDGVIIVTPEYNGGYPASLKNVIDLLNDEWNKKPIAIATASDGIFGGSQVITSLQFSLWKLHAAVSTIYFPVPKIKDAFDENGVASDPAAMEKRASAFIGELMRCIELGAKKGEA